MSQRAHAPPPSIRGWFVCTAQKLESLMDHIPVILPRATLSVLHAGIPTQAGQGCCPTAGTAPLLAWPPALQAPTAQGPLRIGTLSRRALKAVPRLRASRLAVRQPAVSNCSSCTATAYSLHPPSQILRASVLVLHRHVCACACTPQTRQGSKHMHSVSSCGGSLSGTCTVHASTLVLVPSSLPVR